MTPDQFELARDIAHLRRMGSRSCSPRRSAIAPKIPRPKACALLRVFREQCAHSPLFSPIAEGGNELTAVRALQLGAIDYLPREIAHSGDGWVRPFVLALRRIERRAVERQAKLGQTAEQAAAANAAEAANSSRTLRRKPFPPISMPGYVIRSLIGESEKALCVFGTERIARSRHCAEGRRARHPTRPGGRHLLAREYEAISGIRHPAVVELHDYGVHDGREYLAMEYFPRGDLKARMQIGISEQRSAALRRADRFGAAHRASRRHPASGPQATQCDASGR